MAIPDPPAAADSTTQIERKQAPLSTTLDKKQTAAAHIPTSAFPPVNDLPLEIKEPIKITTSKKWVLPPRPKPGRKPVSSSDLDAAAFSIDKDSSKSKVCKPDIHHNHSHTHTHNHNHLRQVTIEKKPFSFPPERDNSISTTVSSANTPLVSSPAEFSCLSPKSSASCMPTPSPTPDSLSPKLESNVPASKPPQTQAPIQPQAERRKRCVAKLAHHAATGSKRKQDQPVATTNNNKMIEVDCSIIHNPLKTEILKINEENYYLKLEVIRLVSNLKGLRDEVQPIVDKRKTKAGRKVKKEKLAAATKSAALPTAAASPGRQSVQKQAQKATTPVLPPPTPPLTAPAASTPAPAPAPATTQKRNHDDDINDLILSLIDLSHSQQTSEPKRPSDEAVLNSDFARNANASTNMTMSTNTTTETNTHTHTDTNKNTSTATDIKRNPETNRNAAKATKTKKPKPKPKTKPSNAELQAEAAPLADAVDFATMNASSSMTTTVAAATAKTSALSPLVPVPGAGALRQGQHSHMQSPVFSNDLVNDPFLELSSKALLDRQTLYDEDDLDLLSTVSTTPSTMFSLSLSATNETVDSVAGSAPMLMGGLDNIDELPPFDLLNLPDEKAIAAGKLDIHVNYDYDRSIAESRYPALDTFSLLDGKADDRDRDIGSLQLLSDRRLSVDGASGTYSSELVDFAMPEDVESVFDTFIHGRSAL